MIDGIKILFLSVNRESFLNNPLIEPHIPPTNKKTGEIKNQPEQAEYKGLKLIIYPTRIELNGSLHKYYNQGFHNYNDFHFRKLESVILELKHELGINLEKSVLNNIEIGVNIELPFKPDKFLNQIIMHRGTPFTWQHDKTKRYRECSHTQFFIKSYDKGIQYKLNRHVFRFELKYIKTEKINQIGVKTLSDLIKPGNLERLGRLILNTFDELLIGNFKTDYSQLNQRDRELFIQGHNEKYWIGLKPTDSTARDYKKDYKRYERRLKRFIELLERTGANQQKKEIRNLIVQKIHELCNPEKTGEIDRDSLPENRGELTGKPEQIKRRKLTNPKKTKTGEIDPLLYSVNLRHELNVQNPKCLVTGIDISNQKKGSKFLSQKSVREIYFQNSKIFNQLLKLYGSKRPYVSNEKQCYYIAHNIRNKYFREQNVG